MAVIILGIVVVADACLNVAILLYLVKRPDRARKEES